MDTLANLLFVATAFLQITINLATKHQCNGGSIVRVSMQHSLNSSGFPQLNARMEHPEKYSNWQIDVELAAANCQTDHISTKILTFDLKGVPQLSGPLRSSSSSGVAQLGHQPLPAGYVSVVGVGYVRPSTKAVTWMEAEAECNAEGATMPLPANQSAAEALASVMNFAAPGHTSPVWAWVGANDFEEEGKWIFTKTGAPINTVSTVSWFPSQPNNWRHENCMVFNKDQATWGDAPCTWKAAFACYIPF